MNSPTHRAYRKKINTQGWMFLGGEVQKITAKNISVTGVLVQLENKNMAYAGKRILQNLAAAKSIDFLFPKLRLSGEAKVVRVESASNDQIMLAMQFNHLANNIDRPVFKRKSYRKEIAVPGRILLNGDYHKFVSVNMSSGGFMLCLPETISIDNNHVTHFEFEGLKLKGFAKIIWIANPEDTQTLMGLQYVKPHKTKDNGGKTEGKLH
ncbi:MAG: PilZ domain-containing protein [Methylovulum sp.]|uniref:PilZ domain-containing protein n=1 Tax=Methylovulum sp. TaxID=1916980 RepID=UPI00262DDB80|nr:PilZ domain-containing protein [Methylovulum sp.]MDD2723734.1 PilZ domain-containing protein [Methylovulum sp.]MDD5125351.1 PilZ domain-containing protein [Methylovulum sp.]